MVQPLAGTPFLPGEERTLEGAPGALIEVDFAEPAEQNDEGVSFEPQEDGSMVVDFAPGLRSHTRGENKREDFGANLAEFLDETEKQKIVQDVFQWVEEDQAARSKWFERLEEGLTILGVVKDGSDLGPMKIAENVHHPLLAEAAVQYQSRAITELLPPAGPAKGQVLGEATEERMRSAVRLADYLNFCCMIEDKSFYPEMDRMLFVQSYEGSQFKKIYYDEIDGMVVSRWVKAGNFIVPYHVSSLQNAPRYTHCYEIQHNDMLKLQNSGFYCDEELSEPGGMGPINNRLMEKKDEAAGEEDPAMWESHPHWMLECHSNWDLIDFPDRNDAGRETGIALPYVAHVDWDSRKLLGLYRNWKEKDALKRKRVWFVHYPFIPGDGFYSYGYVHLAAGLAHGATAALRLLLIGSAFASIAGGFKSKTNRTSGALVLQPGVYQDTDMDYEELSKAFYTPNFKEPSSALYQTLGLLTDAGQRLFSTTESMVGDASNTGPVGTTVALIEEGKKVFSAVHKRGHYAMGEELQILRDLHDEHLPEGGYPYDVPGASRRVMKEDFGSHSNIVPVSDPNIFSSTQRITIAQALRQMATEKPGLYDEREVELRTLEALRVPDPDSVLKNPDKIERCDPVTENAFVMVGRPIKVFIDQAHQFHIPVHKAQLAAMQADAQNNPLLQQRIPLLLNHLAEHMAYAARVQMGQMMGIELPRMDLDADMNEEATEELPPDLENQIAERAAQVAMQLPAPPSAQDQAAQADQLQKLQKELAAKEEALRKQEMGVQAESQNLQNMRSQMEKEAMAEQHRRDKMMADAVARGKELEAENRRMYEDAIRKVQDSIQQMRNEQMQAASKEETRRQKESMDAERKATAERDRAAKSTPAAPAAPDNSKEVIAAVKDLAKEISTVVKAVAKIEGRVEQMGSELDGVTEKLKTRVFKGTIAGKDVSMTMDHGGEPATKKK